MLRTFFPALLLATLFFPSPPSVGAEEALLSPEVRVTISVDWEGTHLNEENLAAMRKFRDAHPDIRLVHFLNAAYFTKPGVNAEDVQQKIRSVLRPGDELGLHLHGWQSLFEAAGVKYRSGPTYEGDAVSRDAAFLEGIVDRGHDVPISSYSTEELRSVVRKSVDILGQNGFKDIKTFRAGGWLGTPDVLAALAAEGIVADSSALPGDLSITTPIPHPLREMAAGAAGQTKVATEPFKIPTPFGAVTEFPDSAGMADYVSEKGIVDMFKANFREMGQSKRAGMHFHMGFHQESANRHLYKIGVALEDIESFLKQRRLSMRNTTLRENYERALPVGAVKDCRTLFEKLKDAVF